ncbi:UDP-glucose 4-epimerase [uncultured Candidatus Thioglobus sp.]|nr:UDP-glucose 4-epimerase [uncultured Candidatus Thioglobus sp.]
MKILITGGSGFIGTNIINHLLKDDNSVLNIDIKPPMSASGGAYWREVDIRDYEPLIKEFIEFNPEYVIHLAAKTDLSGKRIEDYDSNILGTKNIVKAVKELHGIKRVLFASSMLVNQVGYSPLGFSDYNPNTLYGKSKVYMEKIIIESSLTTEWAIIRPTSIWGPWFGEPYSNFFSFVLKGFFVHPGNKACTKTYGYIENSVYQITSLLIYSNKEAVHGNFFYIGDKPPINISEWADEIKFEYNGKRNIKLPFLLFKAIAVIGDFLAYFSIRFPMTMFRLKNMTTNHILPLDSLYKVVGKPPFSRLYGTKKTIKWLKNRK